MATARLPPRFGPRGVAWRATRRVRLAGCRRRPVWEMRGRHPRRARADAHAGRRERDRHIVEFGRAWNSGAQEYRELIAHGTIKHAVLAMTRQMAADCVRKGIRFNALCPGFIDTPFNRGFEVQMGGRHRLEAYVAGQIPAGRRGTVEEIAEGVVYLDSDRSSFMTGHALVIDCGVCI